jgi:hypothetical protein
MNTSHEHDADQLLAIPPEAPERLFTGKHEEAEHEYRRLAARWHPDRCRDPRANAVLAHVHAIYAEARSRLAAGTWEEPGLKRFAAKDGRRFEVRYLKRHELEIGELYLGRSNLTCALPLAHADLAAQACRKLAVMRYGNEAMRRQIAPALPATHPLARFTTVDAEVIVWSKPDDMLLLRDVLIHAGGKIDARHVAWIISGALNLACYLQYAGLTHNGISPDTWCISPARHAGMLAGGWWYACAVGHQLTALPARAVEYGPYDLTRNRKADARTDLELIRAMGRELLGDISGASLARERAAPQAMIDWLRLPASNDAAAEYRIWQQQILKDSFGARRFVEMNLTHSDIYSL